ncbi:type 2 lanthipeptide synthetase LanM family protein [Actinomadura fibrosa]|uniref:Type 2 lanthipeptide synthetase LanM family protein n=1 Tax=Actinomadura fibrosa TaxID=111802 RepID=A0ABW2XAG6_9ACTN|nr:type 2 lanthipeptide synthetase LanM family protein [Actinomadura fibrosa]
MKPTYPVDLAARASNLSERIQVVSGLGPPAAEPLAAFDGWRIERLAAKLAAKFDAETSPRPGRTRHTEQSLGEVLRAYRRHELGLTDPDGPLGRMLAGLHAEWLPVYREALDGYDASGVASVTADWREDDVYYGRFAIACEPFLLLLGRRLAQAIDGGAASGVRVAPRLVRDFQVYLLDQFELALAWAVETDAKVHCRSHGIDPASATRDDYRAYLDKTFADAAAHHRFHLEFPLLGRWLAQATGQLAAHGAQMVERIRDDAAALSERFFGRPVAEVRTARLGRSDHHAGGRSVAIVEVGLADGARESVVYKPRGLGGEAGLQRLLARLRDDGVLGYAERAVLPRDGYGFEALIPPGRNRVATREEAEHVYAELGGYLAIFYVLGGGDLHFENVLVADGHAFICDCETVLGALPKGHPRPSGTLMDSVFKTGLIEWPRGGAAPEGGMRLSGYTGGGGYEIPMPVPAIDRAQSFASSVTYREGVRVEPGAANRVFVGDELTHAEDFAAAIGSGFDRVYEWFRRRPDEAVECVSQAFAGSSVRFINWSTQVYAQLLAAARHPRCLLEPLEADLLINTVRTFPRKWDQDAALPEWELVSMWRQDVPLFTVEAGGTALVHDHASAVQAELETSPLEYAASRIRGLSERNRAQQRQYIAAGLAGADVTSADFAATCVERAAGLGELLCAMLREPDAPAPWTSFLITGEGRDEVDIEGDLYNGSGGIALFLAYLDALDPRPEFRAAARRALAHAVVTVDRRRIGAFTGLGGMIYLLTHLYRLWEEPALLDHALELSDELSGRIERDAQLDVFHGAAGLIPVLIGLAGAADGQGLEQAHRCAEHLLRRAEADGDTLSWPGSDMGAAGANLTGLSHGAGGVGWALIALGRLTDRPEYVSAGRRAFAYEARHFDQSAQDWYDLREFPGGTLWQGRHYANAWCNGASGIGLSRIASWALLGRDDDALLTEARQALTATMRNYPRLMNDSLCHGRSGNAELFLRFALLADEPAFRLEANVQVQAQWRNLEDAPPMSTSGFFPGLMLGLSGFGMHFLRLADPERVPSALLLDAPPPAPIRRVN